MAQPGIRILLVDDDEQFLDALEAMLERSPEVTVVGRAASGDEALRRAAELMPDAITMDLDMPGMSGIEATRLITHYFKIPIVLLSGAESSDAVRAGLAAGAAAHVLKARAWGALLPALRTAVGRSPRG